MASVKTKHSIHVYVPVAYDLWAMLLSQKCKVMSKQRSLGYVTACQQSSELSRSSGLPALRPSRVSLTSSGDCSVRHLKEAYFLNPRHPHPPDQRRSTFATGHEQTTPCSPHPSEDLCSQGRLPSQLRREQSMSRDRCRRAVSSSHARMRRAKMT